MVRKLEELVKDGFDIKKNKDIDLAFLSLKIALNAYFSTYQAFKNSFGIYEKSWIEYAAEEYSKEDLEEHENSDHRLPYCEACAQTIIHFQHFAELVFKGFLRKEHPILATTANQKPIVIHKLISGDKLSESEENGVNTVEFGEAIKRLNALIDSGRLKDAASLGFISRHTQAMQELNTLRNRIWHRGIFILHYKALDEFVGGFILPFVKDVLMHADYAGHEIYWRFHNIHCGVDPVNEIVNCFTSGQPYDLGKIALLKELGRAAYNNKLSGAIPRQDGKLKTLSQSLDRRAIALAQEIASTIAHHEDANIETCPVCGVEALAKYQEHNYEVDGESGDEYVGESYTYRIKCAQCDFNIEGGVKNAKDYGLRGIEDFW